ncbi:hypothetical protein DENSPDRAFT_843415 [Dentipellis sp. KUC8613]|nr:hypothetical protein DENSPDRAFT_843415 [Dentipellis sp. KUC8613]
MPICSLVRRTCILFRQVLWTSPALRLNDSPPSLHGRELAQDPSEEAHRTDVSSNEMILRLRRQWDDLRHPADLDELITICSQATSDFPSTLPASERLFFLSELGDALMHRFRLSGNAPDLDEVINIRQKAVDLCDEDDTQVQAALWDQLQALGRALYRRGEPEDVDNAIVVLRRALALTPEGDPRRDISLDELGRQLGNQFQVSNNIYHIREAISLLQEALYLRPVGHENHLQSVTALALACRDCALESGNSSGLGRAIGLYEEAVEAYQPNSPDRTAYTYELALCYFNRFSMDGDLQDLDQSIAFNHKALACQPPGHKDRLRTLNSLHISLKNRFYETDRTVDLDEAILLKKEALSLIANDHKQRWTYLRSIGECLLDRSRALHSPEDLDEAISMFQDSLTLLPNDHRSKPEVLEYLARALDSRYDHNGDHHDLDDALNALRSSMSLSLVQTDRSALFHCIKSLAVRYDRFSDLKDLEEEISLCNQLTNALTEDDPDYPESLKLLGEALRIKYRNSEDPESRNGLDKATDVLRSALAHLAADSDDQFEYLLILSTCVSDRFKEYGALSDMDEAVDLARRALQTLAPGHRERAGSLDHLAVALFSRFQHIGSREDLDEAIRLQEEALSLRLYGHHNRSNSLTTLGVFLNDRFRFYGNMSDLDEAVTMHREALSLRPKDSIQRPMSMHNLACSLIERGRHYRRLADINEAITLYRDCLDFLQGGWERAGSMTNLADALMDRFEVSRKKDDLQEAKVLLRGAGEARSEDDPDGMFTLSMLGHCLLACYEQLGLKGDLDEAVSVFARLVQERSSSHEGYPRSLFDLYSALHMRGSDRNDDTDREAALKTLKRCVEMTPIGSRGRPKYLMSLAGHYHADSTTAKHALDLLAEALADSSCPPRERVDDAIVCFTRAESAELMHGSELGSPVRRGKLAADYREAVRLLPQIAALDLSIQERLSSLRASGNLSTAGASHFLLLDRPEDALEILEEGRAVFWSQALRLRFEFDDLHAVNPDLAEDLTRISQELSAKDDYGRQKSDLFPTDVRVADEVVAERHLARRRQLGEEFENVLQSIRSSQPGFDRFLLGETFSSLSEVAENGPVVVLLANRLCCRAIVITAPKAALQVELSLISEGRVQRLGADLKEKIQLRAIRNRDAEETTRYSQAVNFDHVDSEAYFEELWVKIVEPIMRALKFEKQNPEGRKRPRLWWCPTGSFTFLPLHAAGRYSHGDLDACSDYVVSSYTPTLSALRDARRRARTVERDDQRLLITSGSSVTGWMSLPGVKREIEAIKNIVPAQNLILPATDETGSTLSSTVQALGDASLVHFACHGQQNANDALESGFVLDGGRLTLSKLMDMQLPRAQFAFLGACETAKGDKGQPDQTVHLAAAMMFVGFKSVVGTMW